MADVLKKGEEMGRYLLVGKDGPLASILAASYDEADAIAQADQGPFGWAIQPYWEPYGPFAPEDKPRDREHVYCMLARDWRVREIVDHGAGTYYRYRVSGQNMNVAPGCYGFDFTWEVPSFDDPRHDLDHAARYVDQPWRVRVRIRATAWAREQERTLDVVAYHEASAGWAARGQLSERYDDVEILSAVCLKAAA